MPKVLGQGLWGVQRWVRDTNHHSSVKGTTTTFKKGPGTVCKGITSSYILLQILHLTWIKPGKWVWGSSGTRTLCQPGAFLIFWPCITFRCSFLTTHKQLVPFILLWLHVRKCSFTFLLLLLFLSLRVFLIQRLLAKPAHKTLLPSPSLVIWLRQTPKSLQTPKFSAHMPGTNHVSCTPSPPSLPLTSPGC